MAYSSQRTQQLPQQSQQPGKGVQSGEVGHVSLSHRSCWLLGISHVLSGAELLFPVSSLLDLLPIECLLPVQTHVEIGLSAKAGLFFSHPLSLYHALRCHTVDLKPEAYFRCFTFAIREALFPFSSKRWGEAAFEPSYAKPHAVSFEEPCAI